MSNYANVSVVIPYYNNSIYVEKALQSIFEQTLLPKEIIVIDDCSSDSHSLNVILKNYINKDDKIKVILHRNSVNKNGAYCRNLGINKARQKYIALLDADDYWMNNHIEVMINSIEENDFIFSNIVYVEGVSLRNKKVTDPSELKNKFDILFFSPPQTNSFFFKKESLRAVSFDESLLRHQDYQFFIDILSLNLKYKYIDSYTTCYRIFGKKKTSKEGYYSVFNFWTKYRNKFDHKLFNKNIMKLLFDATLTHDDDFIFNILKMYRIFDQINHSYNIFLKIILFFKPISERKEKIIRVIYALMYEKMKIFKRFFV
ncbi:glycosyltransferase family 2 protein [Acinetobacter lwoffii]|uniref:glycosyltransferase family 2 protein n=1 Tax=Acinetobacter lwoffii TaxID=28090 RepID=UPI0021CD9AEA|nr:glycosyltransferase family 2 protein [Acinetobacter lwoffii]MCU4614793.1 glycosyltransferase [Acinetobacter lwoffii]